MKKMKFYLFESGFGPLGTSCLPSTNSPAKLLLFCGLLIQLLERAIMEEVELRSASIRCPAVCGGRRKRREMMKKKEKKEKKKGGE
ncbi:hypothetical protein AXF42_Ash006083 [Apostasia shenzhenica]|uniref:Uncharacterized protein n=1 Tax=Apostasia shenzhenica TaxID=1088818 RepID=A0A2I0B066_9ASPA|nr:hypothetical protein AXF42_Ash006083 [Apostasia shenzhenica]